MIAAAVCKAKADGVRFVASDLIAAISLSPKITGALKEMFVEYTNNLFSDADKIERGEA